MKIQLPLNELQELERLLKKAAGVDANDFPFHGHIDTVWISDQLDRVDKLDQRKIDRGKK